MPFTLPKITRRRFLAGTAATGVAALGLPSFGEHAAKTNPNRFALLADTHIPSDTKTSARGVNMSDNLAAVAKQLTELEAKPAAVFIDGDCAYLAGKKKDYANLVGLIKPIRKAGMPVHLALGNHDHRENLWEAIEPTAGQDKVVENKHITLIEAPRATWVLLDSMQKVNFTPGTVGKEQLAWLNEVLAVREEKPVLILVHHDPYTRGSGLVDHEAMFKVIAPRKQVKAVFFGHTHDWRQDKREGIHLINLPPVAYVFKKNAPNGWVDTQLADDGAKLTLVCHDEKHRQHDEVVELEWRA